MPSEDLTPFSISIADDVLTDLRRRLEQTRWTDETNAEPWRYEPPTAYMRRVVDHWLHRYDWRSHEVRLNGYQQFTTEIDGLQIHFLHQPGVGPDPIPLVFTHGWPGSFVEMLRILPTRKMTRGPRSLLAILLLASFPQLAAARTIDTASAASAEEQEVLDAIEAVFSGLASGDVAAIRARLRPTGTATSMIERPDGSSRLTSGDWEDYLDGVSRDAPTVREQLIDPVVRIDGSIAMVWGRYTTSISGELRHCGFDHFDLVRDAGVWKIQNITWTVRFTGCQVWAGAPPPNDERHSARSGGDRRIQHDATIVSDPLENSGRLSVERRGSPFGSGSFPAPLPGTSLTSSAQTAQD